MASTRGWVRGILVAVLALAGVGRLALCDAPGGQEKVTEQNLGRMPGNIVQIATSQTSGGCRVAFVTRAGAKLVVAIDGVPGPEYDGIGAGTLVFSPDGRRVAYAAKKGDKHLVVVDGQAGAEYDGIMKGTPVFSPDGRRVAYTAQKGDKWFVVLDGQAGAEYDLIGQGTPIFSPDGRHAAYAAQNANKWFVVLDGQAGPEYDGIACGPVFLKDGTVEYISQRGDTLYRVNHRP